MDRAAGCPTPRTPFGEGLVSIIAPPRLSVHDAHARRPARGASCVRQHLGDVVMTAGWCHMSGNRLSSRDLYQTRSPTPQENNVGNRPAQFRGCVMALVCSATMLVSAACSESDDSRRDQREPVSTGVLETTFDPGNVLSGSDGCRSNGVAPERLRPAARSSDRRSPTGTLAAR